MLRLSRSQAKLFEYVRGGVLDLLHLDADVRDRLAKMTLLDITPLHAVMKGVMSGDVGDVDKLGFDGEPYPRMEPQVRFDEVNYQPDGRLTVTPSFTYTVQTAPGVEFTPLMTAMADASTIQRRSWRLEHWSMPTQERPDREEDP